MRCEEVLEQFTDYVTDNIREPSRSRVHQHLLACESCRAEAEELKTLWETLGSIRADEPGPNASARFGVTLEAYRHGLDQGPSSNWWPNVNSWFAGWWPRQPQLQFGLALGLLILGVIVGRHIRPDWSPPVQATGEIAELRRELREMRQMVTLSLMQQQSASERLKGVNWSYQLQQPAQEVLSVLLDILTHDSNVNVRLATVDALRQFGDQPFVRRGIVDAITRQESPMVQAALIDLAVDLREKESVKALQQLSQNQNANAIVRQRAAKALAELE